MKVYEALEIVGGLSNPSKMPGRAFSIPAFHCQRGEKLAQIEGTVCHGCFARKGHYSFSTVQNALQIRYLKWLQNRDTCWVAAMTLLVSRLKEPYFRIFDSGDLQSVAMLHDFVAVAEGAPQVHFWLPTRERRYVRRVHQVPENMVIRVSADMVDGPAPKGFDTVSTVSSVRDLTAWQALVQSSTDDHAYCPAPLQDNHCGDCRKCWDRSIHDVTYRKH